MSVINQVLRDLDQRHAQAAAMPAAVRPLPLPRGTARTRRLVLAALALVLVGGTAGTMAWSLGMRSPAAAQPVIVAAAAPAAARSPVVVSTAPVAAASAVPAQPALVDAPARAVPQPTAGVAASAPARAIAALAVPAATPIAPPPEPSGVAPATEGLGTRRIDPAPPAEPRIEKRAPVRTAHERAEAHYRRGVASHQQGLLDDAANAYAAALHEQPGHAPAREALAGARIAQGRADDAGHVLADGLARHPHHPAMSLMLARLHAERGELQQAADLLQPLPTAGASADDLAFRAAIVQRQNRHADAAELFSAALRTAPNHGVWWMGLGISLAADGRRDDAREAFERARGSGTLSPALMQYVEQRLRQLL